MTGEIEVKKIEALLKLKFDKQGANFIN